MLDDLEKSVLKIYEECIGENEANISTIDMLRHIELRMESLTQEQEVLNQKKVTQLFNCKGFIAYSFSLSSFSLAG